MSGCWVIWDGQAAPLPGASSIEPSLANGVFALRRHSDISDATYQYNPYSGRVRFILQVRFGLVETAVKVLASRALHQCLGRSGISISTWRSPAPGRAGQLRLQPWPSSFRWGRRP